MYCRTFGLLYTGEHLVFYGFRTFGLLYTVEHLVFYGFRTFGLLYTVDHLAFYILENTWPSIYCRTLDLLYTVEHLAFYILSVDLAFYKADEYDTAEEAEHERGSRQSTTSSSTPIIDIHG